MSGVYRCPFQLLRSYKRHKENKSKNGQDRSSLQYADYQCYRSIVRPILNYAATIWFTKVSSTHLDKLEDASRSSDLEASHLRIMTGVLFLRAHLELCSQQFYASALQPMHPSHIIVTRPPDPSPLRVSCHRILRGLRARGDNPNTPTLNFGVVLEEVLAPWPDASYEVR